MSAVPLTRTRHASAHEGDASTVRALNCPNCGGSIALRAAGTTVSLVCEHCGSTLDATRPDLAIILRANEALRRPAIALGTRGELDGTTWEAIGYQERTDGEEAWSEYLLFNPYQGYAFLIDDGDRFSLGRLLDRLPVWDGEGLAIGRERYEATYAPYPARVTFVVGEFYWRVRVGEQVTVTDYAAPNVSLSCEENGQERSWTRFDLLPRGMAEAAFGVEQRQAAWGATPRPDEPSPYLRRLKEAAVIGLLAVAVLLFLGMNAPSRQSVLQRDIQVPFDEQTHSVVIGPIALPSTRQSVHVSARAESLDNSWLDLDYSLVDRRTQRSFDGYATAERYHGRDSDGNWAEGDPSPSVQFASIPAGQYDLVVEGGAHRWLDPAAPTPIVGIASQPAGDTVPVTITVERGGGTGGLLFLFLLLIAAWPGMLWLMHVSYEKRRRGWAAADDEDDDE